MVGAVEETPRTVGARKGNLESRGDGKIWKRWAISRCVILSQCDRVDTFRYYMDTI